MKKILSFILALMLVLTVAMPATIYGADLNESVYAAAKERAAQDAKLLTEKYGAVSVQYALIDNGEIAVSGNSGVYSKTENRMLTEDTMYGIGSTSKMFVATAVMKLVDMNKINLDTPVVNYIPEFKMADERYKNITPRMLLNHSSGLWGSSFNNAFLFDDNDSYSHDHFLEMLSEQNLKADPGAFSVYCNDGFTLAEILVEKVSNMSFVDFVQKYFTEPLKMGNTKTPLDDFDRKNLARTYSAATGAETPSESVNIIGTGGIYSTAQDLCKFAQMFTGQSDILSDKSVKAMEADEFKKGIWPEEKYNSIGYGLGWDSVNLYPFTEYNIKALTKGGDTPLFHSALVVLPEHNIAVAVTSSGGVSTVNQMMANNMILEVLKAKGIIDEIKPAKTFEVPVKSEMPAEVAAYAGIYGSSQPLKINIKSDGTLEQSMLYVPSVPAEVYQYTKDGNFKNSTGSSAISFVKETNGLTYLKVEAFSDIDGLGQTVATTYQGQKLEDNNISDEIYQLWKNRGLTPYLSVCEKYTSQSYFPIIPMTTAPILDETKGYLLNSKIINENEAVNVIQIPGSAGRDTFDYKYVKENGVEYLTTGKGSVFIPLTSVKPIYAGSKSICTVQDNGYAVWYTVGAELSGKTITVDVPDNSGFAVYDSNGMSVWNYAVDKGNSCKLPEGGYIVFAGDVGNQFGIEVK